MQEEFLQYAEQYGLRIIKSNKVLFVVDDYMMPEGKAGEKSKVDIKEHINGSHYFMEMNISNEGDKRPSTAVITICPQMLLRDEKYRNYMNKLIASTKITADAFVKPAKFFVSTRTMDSLSFQDRDEHYLREVNLEEALAKAVQIGGSNIVEVEVELKDLKKYIDDFNVKGSKMRGAHNECPFCKVLERNKEKEEEVEDEY